jgi:hypothetical protein
MLLDDQTRTSKSKQNNVDFDVVAFRIFVVVVVAADAVDVNDVTSSTSSPPTPLTLTT